jgi:DNA-binding GntR family transcriptional regulator
MLNTDDISNNRGAQLKPVALKSQPSLKAKAYAEILQRINILQFRPGDFLNETQIAESLELGRTSGREALSQLQHEGIVAIAPRKGIIIKPISLNDVLEIIEVRLINEVHCAGLAAERATEAEIAQMSMILQRAEFAIAPCDYESSMDLDREFHDAMAEAAKNRVLAEILRTLHKRLLRFWFMSLAKHQHLERVQDEHRSLFEAIARHDGDGARAAMRAHIDAFRKNIAAVISTA